MVVSHHYTFSNCPHYSWDLLFMETQKENEIKDSFAKTLNMYPIKNLEDLYDKEGYRDEEFDKDDKGEWILQSSMATQGKMKI